MSGASRLRASRARVVFASLLVTADALVAFRPAAPTRTCERAAATPRWAGPRHNRRATRLAATSYAPATFDDLGAIVDLAHDEFSADYKDPMSKLSLRLLLASGFALRMSYGDADQIVIACVEIEDRSRRRRDVDGSWAETAATCPTDDPHRGRGVNAEVRGPYGG